QRILARLRSMHHFKRQRLAAHRVEHLFVARDAALADRVIQELRARSRRSQLVIDSEARGLGSQQLIARVFIRLGLRTSGRRQHNGIFRYLRGRTEARRCREANYSSETSRVFHAPSIRQITGDAVSTNPGLSQPSVWSTE